MPNPKNLTERIFQSPSKYIQGPNAIKNAASYLSNLGKAPLLACDELVYKIAGKSLIDNLTAASFTVTHAHFNGEASTLEINRLASLGKDASSDFIIALGGGKVIDSAKNVADILGLPVAVLPTTASTDAPCSALSVIYTEGGEFERYSFYDKNPNIVLVDTSVIVTAPARFLAAGIGDAVATNVEAKLARNSPNFGKLMPTELSEAIGSKCEEILFRYGRQAYEANKAKAVTPAFEAVVEANTLLSGLGFESGGLAAAHAIHNGFTAIHAMHGLMHGEKVAFGVVAQLILANAPTAELDRYISLMLSVDLPVTFAQLGIPNVTDEELRAVAKLSVAEGETIWNMEGAISEDIVFHALKGANAASEDYLRRSGWKKLD
ncbi:glycerol dehydrogenase [Irpex rosettiformis]|uniref:Glycerol dehydrogenase n=1 Tax=Irpex rosettiformis TaxID=378272 RepID=A0ACB8TV84_9APHY|nr:glycerol dehydrogenase [Irpex rosettiformis]